MLIGLKNKRNQIQNKLQKLSLTQIDSDWAG